MAKVEWTPEAERWLQDIHDYIAEDNPDAAFRTIVSIIKRAQILASFPELGYRYDRRTDRHIRIMVFGHYRIAYVIKESRDVDIVGVFHGPSTWSDTSSRKRGSSNLELAQSPAATGRDRSARQGRAPVERDRNRMSAGGADASSLRWLQLAVRDGA